MILLRWWERFKKLTTRFTQPHKRRSLYRYSFPIILLVVAYLLKSYLSTTYGVIAPYLLSTFIIALSSWYGGLGPGVFATILGALVNNFIFLEPRFSFMGIGNAITTVIFLIQGIFISMISEAKRNADMQKDEFISFASHELKNPLAVLKGYTALLQKRSKDKKVLEYINTFDTHIDKITNLINELLDVTKLESGKLSLHKEKLDIYPLVHQLIYDQQLVSDTHKIVLHGKVSRRMFVDRVRIGQVITNMLTNAVKYSPGKKKVDVTITTKKGGIIIAVKDYGIGLSQYEQQKVFDRFYRAQNATIEGLGLGLYISLMIINLHHGKLWVESEKGKGSTFYLILPIK